MHIHTDSLTRDDLYAALREANIPGVYIDSVAEHGSRKRRRRFDVRLAAEPGPGHRRRRNTGTYGAEDGGQELYVAAATWEEHGEWFAQLYALDPLAVIAEYTDAAQFSRQTKRVFDEPFADALQYEEHPQTGERQAVISTATCGTCGRSWNDALITGRTPTPSARCPFEYDHSEALIERPGGTT